MAVSFNERTRRHVQAEFYIFPINILDIGVAELQDLAFTENG